MPSSREGGILRPPPPETRRERARLQRQAVCQICEDQLGRLPAESSSSQTPSLLSWVITVHHFQIGSYFGSELCPLDTDMDGITNILLVAAPMFLGPQNKETGRIYVYVVGQVRISETP